jgi:hypothetical protein
MALILSPPGTQAPLPQQLAGLGRTRRAAAAGGAMLALVGWVAAAVLVSGALDATLHLPPLARGFLLVGTLAGAGVLGLRVRDALRLPTDPLTVALELENRFPRLNDSLASAVSSPGPGTTRGYRTGCGPPRSARRSGWPTGWT